MLRSDLKAHSTTCSYLRALNLIKLQKWFITESDVQCIRREVIVFIIIWGEGYHVKNGTMYEEIYFWWELTPYTFVVIRLLLSFSPAFHLYTCDLKSTRYSHHKAKNDYDMNSVLTLRHKQNPISVLPHPIPNIYLARSYNQYINHTWFNVCRIKKEIESRMYSWWICI